MRFTRSYKGNAKNVHSIPTTTKRMVAIQLKTTMKYVNYEHKHWKNSEKGCYFTYSAFCSVASYVFYRTMYNLRSRGSFISERV